jgi:predicted dehydrogenase
VEVVATAAENKERAVAFTKKFDTPDFYDDYRLIFNRKDINMINLSGR